MRTNLRAIAKEAGVGVATASRAMRGLANVSPAARRRVEEAARKLGYVRDPQLSSALAFARRPEKPVYRETFAFLGALPESEHAKIPWLRGIHAGFCERAANLGYTVRYITTPRQTRAQRVLSRELHSQGIRGLAVSSRPEWSPFSMELTWEHFAAVELGRALWSPSLPRVDREITDDFFGMFAEIRQRGYQRIGLAMSHTDEVRRRWSVLATYLLFQHQNRDLPALRPLEEEDGRDYSAKALERWIEREKPDVIVVNGSEPLDWLREAGWRVPEDVALCRIDCLPDRPETGLAGNYEQMGASAVDLLSSALERGELGLLTYPGVHSTPNRWHEGETLPALKGQERGVS
ncbi:LacI family transcriptional regulator [Opitutaceae bacterium TAV5]|nr:LacI family transcriptional regulator [Opitutaceae bacterium TAV5]